MAAIWLDTNFTSHKCPPLCVSQKRTFTRVPTDDKMNVVHCERHYTLSAMHHVISELPLWRFYTFSTFHVSYKDHMGVVWKGLKKNCIHRYNTHTVQQKKQTRCTESRLTKILIHRLGLLYISPSQKGHIITAQMSGRVPPPGQVEVKVKFRIEFYPNRCRNRISGRRDSLRVWETIHISADVKISTLFFKLPAVLCTPVTHYVVSDALCLEPFLRRWSHDPRPTIARERGEMKPEASE